MAGNSIMVTAGVRRVVERYAGELLELYRAKLTESGVGASGELVDSMEQKVTDNQDGYSVVLTLKEYWKYIEEGRLPGSWPPVEALAEWIRRKGVVPTPFQLPDGKSVIPTEKQLAYVVGRKIFTDGIVPRPYLSESTAEWQEPFLRDLTWAVLEEVMKRITEELDE